MALRLFKRGAKVTLVTPRNLPNAFFDREPGSENAIEITDLRVKFSIEKHVKSDPNKCEVTVYNLAERTRALCETRPLTVWIDAGYDGVLRQLFTGDVRHSYSKLEKPEWQTVMHLGDGDRATRLARLNKTYGIGTPSLQVIKDLAGAMGLTLNPQEIGKIAGLQAGLVLPRAVQGTARDEMTRILAPLGVSWSIQDGRLQLLRDGDLVDGEAVLVSEDTGMIGTPEYTSPQKEGKPPQLRVKMLLYPQLRPGALIEVQSRAVAHKQFRIQRVVHKGDTYGQDWTSEIEALPSQPGANS